MKIVSFFLFQVRGYFRPFDPSTSSGTANSGTASVWIVSSGSRLDKIKKRTNVWLVLLLLGYVYYPK